jgi:hypothetical protein
MLKSSVSLFVGFVYVVICTMMLSIEDHGQQIGSNPMTRTTSPRKRNAVGFRAKQRVRAFDSAQDRVPATCSRLAASTSQPSPEGARQRHVGAPCSGVAAQVAGSLFSKVSRSRHATTVSELFWRSGGGCPSWAATCASFLAAWLRCPRQNGLAFRPSPRTAVSGGWCTVRRKVYTGYTRPPGYLKRWIPTRLGGDLSSVGSVLG